MTREINQFNSVRNTTKSQNEDEGSRNLNPRSKREVCLLHYILSITHVYLVALSHDSRDSLARDKSEKNITR